MKKKDVVGVLDPAFDWKSLSPDDSLRILFANNPSAAVERVRELERFNERLDEIASQTYFPGSSGIMRTAGGRLMDRADPH
jgi:hypothetical protein